MCAVDPLKKGCEECNHTGWLHMDSPFEIEKCDNCGTFEYDEDAQAAHLKGCKCDWPIVDYHSAFLSWFYLQHPDLLDLPAELCKLAELIEDIAAERKDFATNIVRLMGHVGQTIYRAIHSTHPQRSQWINTFLTQLRGAGSILLQVNYLVSSGQWKAHWLLSSDHGTYDDKTGLWHAPPEKRANG